MPKYDTYPGEWKLTKQKKYIPKWQSENMLSPIYSKLVKRGLPLASPAKGPDVSVIGQLGITWRKLF